MGTRGVDGVHEQRLRLRVGERHRDYLARKSLFVEVLCTLLPSYNGRANKQFFAGFEPALHSVPVGIRPFERIDAP